MIAHLRHAAALIACAAAVGLIAAHSPAAGADGALQVTGAPSLFPAFDATISDYVSRCGESGQLKLSVSAPAGTTVSVDGRPRRSGTFDELVRLGSGQEVVVAVDAPGSAASYHVRCLPPGFPDFVVERAGATAAQWFLVSPSEHYAALFDSNGVPVWWMHSKHVAFNPTLLRGGVVAWYDLPKEKWFKFGVIPDGHYAVHRLDGVLVRKLRTVDVPTDLHEIQQLPNGHFLLDAYRARKGVDLSRFHGPKKATVFYGEAQEITREGRLVWRWSSRGHVALSETGRWWPALVQTQAKFPKASRLYDVFHINSISADGDGYVISGRHVDAVYRIDKATRRVDWKLGGTRTERSLKIVGDPEHGSTTFGGQHDARILPDGTLTVFDNGAERDRRPRLVRYRIDAKQRTATLIEQLTDPVIDRASWGGGTRRLPGGDWVTGWGGAQYVTEYEPSGESAFRLNLPIGNTYRAYPVLPGVLTPARLRAAMNRMHPRG